MADAAAIRSIGIVLHDFSLGGTEAVVSRLAGAWAAQGLAVTIFCGSRSGTTASVAEAGVTVVEARPVLRRSEGSRSRLAAAAAQHFRRHPVDLLLVPGNVHWPIVAPLTHLPGRPPVVVQVGAALRRRPPAGLAAWRLRWALRGVAALVAPSLEPEGGVTLRLAGHPLHPLPLAVLGDDDPGPLPLPAGASLIVAQGRGGSDAGLETTIAVLAAQPDSAVKLAILSAGTDQTRLQQAAAARGVADRVRFAGSGASLRQWLDRAHLLLLPTASEAHGAAIVEALAAGRPVLAAVGTPGAALLDPATILPPDEPATWTRAIEGLLHSPGDGTALARRADSFRLQAAAAGYLRFFATLVKGAA